MLTGLHVPGTSRLHRAAPATKLVGLAILCSAVLVVDSPSVLAGAALLVAVLWAIAGLPPRLAAASLRPALWVLALVFAVQFWLAGGVAAALVTARFAILILAASLVTLTTSAAAFLDGFKALLARAPAFVPADDIALALSLALRFIPLVRDVAAEVRQAQAARGLDGDVLALVVPTLVRTLKTADEMAAAIQARSPG